MTTPGVPVVSTSEPKSEKVKVINNAPLTYTYGSVCLLCLKTKTCTSVKSDLEKHRQSRLICMKYVVLVSRYLKLDTELTKISHKSYFGLVEELKGSDDCGKNNEIDFKEEISKFVICDLCLPLAESFCKTYHEYEVIRMKLEAKLVESASCVQKSEDLGESLKVIRGIKRMKSDSVHDDEDTLIDFRSLLKTHGSKLVKLNGPKVKLKRDQKAEAELVQRKIPKLKNSEDLVACTKSLGDLDQQSQSDIAPNAETVSTPCTKQRTSSVKIVRRAAGAQSGISIFRVSGDDKPRVETNNNDDSDIQIIDVIEKHNEARNSGRLDGRDRVCRAGPASVLRPCKSPTMQQPSSTLTALAVTNASILLNPVIFQSSPLVNNFTQPRHSHSQVGSELSSVSTSGNVFPLPIQFQTCNINGCGLTFPKTEQGSIDIQRHLSTHGGLACSKCTSVLKTPFELITHELKHNDSDSTTSKVNQGFQCLRCSHYSLFRTEHQEHFLENHLNTKIELLKCVLCKKGFSHLKEEQFRTHIINSHPNANEDDMRQCHRCMVCPVYFKKKATLWKHLKNDHRINCKDGPYKCPDCPESFFLVQLKLLHREFSCGKKQQYKCSYPGCLSTFARVDSLNKHVEETHNDANAQALECPICKLRFNDSSSLTEHVQTHNGEQVKLVFTEGNNQEPQVIPVEVNDHTPTTTSTNSANPLPFYHSLHHGVNGYNAPLGTGFAPICNVPLITTPTPLQTPVIVAVTGAAHISTSSSTTVAPSFFASNQQKGMPNSHDQPVDMIQAELLDMFFDESNDTEEPMMDIFGNEMNGEGREDELSPPDEDPFAWMYGEDF